MLINREKETNGKAVTYLDRLQENYHDLFFKPLQKSEFTETDIKMIETEWGYELPKPYIDFLQSYQLPKCCMVSASLCGTLEEISCATCITYFSAVPKSVDFVLVVK